MSSDWPVTVVWETDFPLASDILDSASFRPTLVPAGARRRNFDLVLPPLETPGSEDGCKFCTEYRVTVTAVSSVLNTSASIQ